MWVPGKLTGEYAVDIGAKVQFTDSGQIQVVDDDGDVSPCFLFLYITTYLQVV